MNKKTMVILFVILLSNFLLWKFEKKQSNQNIKNKNKKITLIKLTFILIVLVFTVGSVFLLPDVWIKFNGWWF